MDIQISVLTLVKGRKNALLNLIQGLALNHNQQMELVVVHMNEESYALPDTAFPIRKFQCNTNETLPLAEARNLALAQAQYEYCIFLDVDCIPASNLITHYQNAFAKEDIVWSGQVRYLQPGFPEHQELNDHSLQHWSKADPIRGNRQSLPYELFWSLNFGCSKTVFAQIGGFDVQYTGYGAEDTDFSFSARKNGVPLALLPAVAYHQPHASYNPPLNHLQDIVANATVFYHKWQRWPMEGWLTQFVQLGYITWSADSLAITRIPTPAEIENFHK